MKRQHSAAPKALSTPEILQLHWCAALAKQAGIKGKQKSSHGCVFRVVPQELGV